MKLYFLCIAGLFFIGCIIDPKSPTQDNQQVEISSSSEMSSSSNTLVPIPFTVSLFNLNNVLKEDVSIDSIVTIVLSTDGEERFVDETFEKNITGDRYSTAVEPLTEARFNIEISVYSDNYVVGVATKSSVFVQEYSEAISLTLGLIYSNLEHVNKGIPKAEEDEVSSVDEESSDESPSSYAEEESDSVDEEESSIEEISYAESSEAAEPESSDMWEPKEYTENIDDLIVFDSFNDGDAQTDFAANLAMSWNEYSQNAGGLWSVDHDSESLVIDQFGTPVGQDDIHRLMNNGTMHFSMITGPEGGYEEYHVVKVSAPLLHQGAPVDLQGVESIVIIARGTGTIMFQFEGLDMPDWGRYETQLVLGDTYQAYQFDVDEFMGSEFSYLYGSMLSEQLHEVTEMSFFFTGYDAVAEVEIDEIVFVGIDVIDVPWVNN